MNRETDTKTRRIAATEARVHFGELVDDVVAGRKIAEVDRADGYTVVVEPADDEADKPGFDAKAWFANLRRIQAEIRAWRERNGIPEITEMPEDIMRELHESR
ncbi:MAG TPA: hypothetical protein VFI12_07485 [Thermomicrobiales bacterium]|nr:hypothetical protein [Thermomicrobiales bacterium]